MKLANTGEIAKARNAFANEVEAQVTLSQFLSIVSPSAAFVFLASDTAHTGLESERRFRRSVFRYRRRFADLVDDHIDRTGDYSRMMRIHRDFAPAFTYRELTHSQVIAAHLPNFVVLVLHPLLLFLVAQVVFIRAQF
jgi:hypothetical protein